MSARRDEIVTRIVAERIRQFQLPGVEYDRLNSLGDWTTLIGHYLFEEVRRGPSKPSRDSFEDALIKASAVLLAALEHCDELEAKHLFSRPAYGIEDFDVVCHQPEDTP